MRVIGLQRLVFILLIQKNPMISSLQYGKNQHIVDVEDQENSIPSYHLLSSEKISQRLYMLILLAVYLWRVVHGWEMKYQPFISEYERVTSSSSPEHFACIREIRCFSSSDVVTLMQMLDDWQLALEQNSWFTRNSLSVLQTLGLWMVQVDL